MRPQITGTILPVLEIGLDPGELVIAAPGELAWMTPNVRMTTTTATAGASGLSGAFTRAVSGGGLFMTEFIADGPGGVAFTPKIPGQIVPVEVQLIEMLLTRAGPPAPLLPRGRMPFATEVERRDRALVAFTGHRSA